MIKGFQNQCLVNLVIACGSSSIGRVPALQAGCCGFDARLPLKYILELKMTIEEINKEIEKLNGDTNDIYDGYHTFKQLYDFRREYNAALVNSGIWKSHKSHRHHDGELCFCGGWFIVMIDTPFGQISNHYEDEYWNEFKCEERYIADEWDGHDEMDVLNRLHESNMNF